MAVISDVDSAIRTTRAGGRPTRGSTVDTIVERVRNHERANHVVVTGGEPLMHDQTVTLLDHLCPVKAVSDELSRLKS